MSTCVTCGGLIMKQGVIYGYAGKVCQCTPLVNYIIPVPGAYPSSPQPSAIVQQLRDALENTKHGCNCKHPQIKQHMQASITAANAWLAEQGE